MRSGTKKRTEKVAKRLGVDLIDLDIVEKGVKEGLKMMEEMIKKQSKSGDGAPVNGKPTSSDDD